VLHRRTIVFLLSDFLDRGFESALKRTGGVTTSSLCTFRPAGGGIAAGRLLELEDAETGELLLLDTNSRQVREAFARNARQRQESLRQLARSAHIDLIDVSTDGNHLDALIRFFKLREHRSRRT